MKIKKLLTALTAVTLSLAMTVTAYAKDYTTSTIIVQGQNIGLLSDDTFTVDTAYITDGHIMNIGIINVKADLTATVITNASGGIINVYNGATITIPKGDNFESFGIINLYKGSNIVLEDDGKMINYGTINNYTGTDISGQVNNTKGKIETEKKFSDPDKTGTTPVRLKGRAISAPDYTVTIPEKFDFGEIERVNVYDTDENKLVKTEKQTVTVKHKNIWENEKELSVTFSSDFTMKSSETSDTLTYSVLNSSDENIATNTEILSVGTEQDSELTTDTYELYAQLDKSTIRYENSYTGTVTFTVALKDVEAE